MYLKTNTIIEAIQPNLNKKQIDSNIFIKKKNTKSFKKLLTFFWLKNLKVFLKTDNSKIFIKKKIKSKKLKQKINMLKIKKLLIFVKKSKKKTDFIKKFNTNYYISKLVYPENKYILKLLYNSQTKNLKLKYKFEKKILNFDKLELKQKKKFITAFFTKKKTTKKKNKNIIRKKKNLIYQYYQLKLAYTLTALYKQKFNVTLQNSLNILNKNDLLERLNSSIFNKVGGMRAQKFNSHLAHTVNLINLSCLYFDPSALVAHFANEFKIKKNQKIILLQSRYILKQFIQNPYSPLKGVMVLVSGRINNIKRTRKFLLKLGEIHVQTMKNNIFYSFDTSITKFGAFGLKIWIHL